MDALEPLLQRDLDILKPTDYNYTISFIGSVLEFNGTSLDSISSISRIGEELGRDFEIVVAHTTIPEGLQDRVRSLRKSCPNVVLLESGMESHGEGKGIAFEYSTGKFIVPFNTGIIYPIGYSDVIHDFLKFKLKRLYYSELPIISREVVSEVGGWRKLSNGEDIDLYSRISINYGVFACPTNLLDGDDHVRREILSIREFVPDRSKSFGENYRHIRDLIISCNHSFSDIRYISKVLRDVEGQSRSGLFLLSFLGSRFSRVKPVTYNRNNYIILMESILESLILREYLKLSDVSDRMSWHIDRTHIKFLIARSKMFREMKDSTAMFLKDQI